MGSQILITVNNNITHEGVVVGQEGQKVTVRFVQHSACSGCHAKALCSGGSSESAEKVVVANAYGQLFAVGEHVRVIVGGGLAWSAVIIAFIVPIVLAMITLFVVVGMTQNEMLGAIAALVLLGLYYLIVWTQRNKLERKVEFTLERDLSFA